MKKIILIGATILIASTAIFMAANSNCTAGCDECPIGICKPGGDCGSTNCCKK
ncbi:MAG: hypothetical protein Q8L81_09565 [Bacteroidota bacterium]|nr:hypothetical protein [Bacteroidota bacterium]